MKHYNIKYKKQAIKFIESRSHDEQERLLTAISNLPCCSNIKKMEGYEHRYRLRTGDYRVIYDQYDDYLLILVLKIGSRGDVYK